MWETTSLIQREVFQSWNITILYSESYIAYITFCRNPCPKSTDVRFVNHKQAKKIRHTSLKHLLGVTGTPVFFVGSTSLHSLTQRKSGVGLCSIEKKFTIELNGERWGANATDLTPHQYLSHTCYKPASQGNMGYCFGVVLGADWLEMK